ncbi:gliding motility lipoprotein GldH [Sunxiuqinia sp. A32]|uniref:gliding motility lipoprotein GldH n=1 Tax=Sunxiuqinia sp. A32 TaxID=3461496 RepID=UPI004045F95B
MKRFLVILLLATIIFSCDDNRIFEDYHTIDTKGWHKDSIQVFEVEASDAQQNHNVYINIRNKGNYPNSNLWLFLTIDSPDGESLTDTVEFVLAEPSGKWTGSGIGDLFDNQFPYRQNVYFPEAGTYRFSIQQGMRTELLEGIHDVGLRIEKQN